MLFVYLTIKVLQYNETNGNTLEQFLKTITLIGFNG